MTLSKLPFQVTYNERNYRLNLKALKYRASLNVNVNKNDQSAAVARAYGREPCFHKEASTFLTQSSRP